MDKDHSTHRLKALIFTCNWNAYSALEAAGRERRRYSAAVRPIRLTCLGRLHPGLILKAFERGADGVLLLGCAPEDCRYQFGGGGAEELVAVSRRLLTLLGFHEKQLQLDHLAAGDGKTFADRIDRFMSDLARIAPAEREASGVITNRESFKRPYR